MTGYTLYIVCIWTIFQTWLKLVMISFVLFVNLLYYCGVIYYFKLLRKTYVFCICITSFVYCLVFVNIFLLPLKVVIIQPKLFVILLKNVEVCKIQLLIIFFQALLFFFVLLFVFYCFFFPKKRTNYILNHPYNFLLR